VVRYLQLDLKFLTIIQWLRCGFAQRRTEIVDQSVDQVVDQSEAASSLQLSLGSGVTSGRPRADVRKSGLCGGAAFPKQTFVLALQHSRLVGRLIGRTCYSVSETERPRRAVFSEAQHRYGGSICVSEGARQNKAQVASEIILAEISSLRKVPVKAKTEFPSDQN